MKYFRHIYFDLDRTLWDFETNARSALEEIFYDFHLNKSFLNAEEFFQVYNKHNERLWAKYRRGSLNKEILRSKRFELTLREKKIKDPQTALQMGKQYLMRSVEKTHLFPNTHEILDYLFPSYPLYIITNGFRETQILKLKNCKLEKYFKQLFTSETIGINKPDSRIFHWAVSSVNAKKEECLMIGDDQEVDIAGANSYGIATVFFNPKAEETRVKNSYEISNLIELKEIL